MFDAKTLDAWLTHIEVLHSKPIDLGLDRMKTMVERMGLDFSSRTVITVGGTNGKGSTCAMLESIYRAAGYTTGMHTSPHLIRLNERCVVNGREVDDERLMAQLLQRLLGSTKGRRIGCGATQNAHHIRQTDWQNPEIGRASCRERV